MAHNESSVSTVFTEEKTYVFNYSLSAKWSLDAASIGFTEKKQVKISILRSASKSYSFTDTDVWASWQRP